MDNIIHCYLPEHVLRQFRYKQSIPQLSNAILEVSWAKIVGCTQFYIMLNVKLVRNMIHYLLSGEQFVLCGLEEKCAEERVKGLLCKRRLREEIKRECSVGDWWLVIGDESVKENDWPHGTLWMEKICEWDKYNTSQCANEKDFWKEGEH